MEDKLFLDMGTKDKLFLDMGTTHPVKLSDPLYQTYDWATSRLHRIVDKYFISL